MGCVGDCRERGGFMGCRVVGCVLQEGVLIGFQEGRGMGESEVWD